MRSQCAIAAFRARGGEQGPCLCRKPLRRVAKHQASVRSARLTPRGDSDEFFTHYPHAGCRIRSRRLSLYHLQITAQERDGQHRLNYEMAKITNAMLMPVTMLNRTVIFVVFDEPDQAVGFRQLRVCHRHQDDGDVGIVLPLSLQRFCPPQYETKRNGDDARLGDGIPHEAHSLVAVRGPVRANCGALSRNLPVTRLLPVNGLQAA